MLTIDSATSAGGSHPGELRVVVTFPLPAEHLTALRGQLVPGYRIEDVFTATAADIVVCPPCSRATIERLHEVYPGAVILVVETAGRGGRHDDDAPVTRILAAGAAAYSTNASSEGMASAIRSLPRATPSRRPGPRTRSGSADADGGLPAPA